MDKKIYVFDMDDTLVDTHRRYEDAILRVLDEARVSYDVDTLLPQLNPMGLPRTITYFSQLGVPGSEAEILERLMVMMEELYTSDRVWLMPGVEDCLRRLQEAGARLFVLTATPHRVSDACLRALGIYDRFEKVWCTEDFDRTKQQPELFWRVTRALGCAPEEICYIDDSAAAICTARQVGWYTCGYLAPLAVEGEGMAEAAHRCLRHFEEL